MIKSTSSTDRASQANAITPQPADTSATTVSAPSDQVSTDQAAYLKAALARQPEVRPEVVARGKELAADPSYPSTGVITNVASRILNSPDPSEDES